MGIETFAIFASLGIILHLFYVAFYRQSTRLKNLMRREPDGLILGSPLIPIIVFLGVFATLVVFFDFRWMLLERSNQLTSDISSEATLISFIVKSMPALIGYAIVDNAVRNNKKINLFSLFLIYALLIVFCNPVNTPRFVSLGGFLLPILPLILKGLRLNFLLLLFPIISTILLPVTSLMRQGIDNVDFALAIEVLNTAEFSAMFVLNEALLTLPEAPLSMGHYILSAIFILVPRSFWPEKNSGTGIDTAHELDFIFTNIGIPPVYDFLLDFSYAGVALLGLLLALIISNLQKVLDHGRGGVFKRSLPAIYFVTCPVLMRGDMTTAFVLIYALMISSIIVAFLLNIGKRTSVSASRAGFEAAALKSQSSTPAE